MNINHRLSPVKDVRYKVVSTAYAPFFGDFQQAIGRPSQYDPSDKRLEYYVLQFDYPEYEDGRYFVDNTIRIRRDKIKSLTLIEPPESASAESVPASGESVPASAESVPASASGGKTYKKHRSKRRITRKNRQTKKKQKSRRR